MKTHLAGVILAGFYLMTPPCHYPCTGDEFPDTHSPLSRWTLSTAVVEPRPRRAVLAEAATSGPRRRVLIALSC